MNEFFALVPEWFGVITWLVMLAGFLMQRKAWVNQNSNVNTSIKGNQNQITNQVKQSASNPPAKSDSALAKWGNWATIAGLLFNLLPLLKGWLAVGT